MEEMFSATYKVFSKLCANPDYMVHFGEFLRSREPYYLYGGGPVFNPEKRRGGTPNTPASKKNSKVKIKVTKVRRKKISYKRKQGRCKNKKCVQRIFALCEAGKERFCKQAQRYRKSMDRQS